MTLEGAVAFAGVLRRVTLKRFRGFADFTAELGAIDQATLRAVKKLPSKTSSARSPRARTWHKGRDRARAILGVVRAEIPSNRRGAFPTDLARLIAEAAPEKIRDLGLAIPDEVQRLLELMVEP